MKNHIRSLHIPTLLYNEILKLKLSKSSSNHLYKFIKILENKSRKTGLDMQDYVPISYNYIIKTFNGKYSLWLKPAIKSGILEEKLYPGLNGTVVKFKHARKVKGKPDEKGICKAYRINPKLMRALSPSHFTSVSYVDKNSFPSKDFFFLRGANVSKRIIYNDFDSITIDEERLLDITYKKVLNIEYDYKSGKSEKYLKIDEAVEVTSFEVIDRIHDDKFYISREKALKQAKKLGCNLIQYRNDFYLDDINKFIIRKQRDTGYNYYNGVRVFNQRDYYANRNLVNHRLDHNLTAFPSILIKEIIKENNLCEVDVSNAQFAIIAYLMQYLTVEELAMINTKDVSKFKIPHILHKSYRLGLNSDMQTFIECAEEGTLYEYIQDAFGMPPKHRDVAKIMMMELTFSRPGNKSTNKGLLTYIFPSVVSYFDTYKKLKTKEDKEDGYKQLPILLQQIEAEMFIDNIFYEVKNRELFAIPKHDSIIIRRENEAEVKKIMEAYFASIGFRFKHKTSI